MLLLLVVEEAIQRADPLYRAANGIDGDSGSGPLLPDLVGKEVGDTALEVGDDLSVWILGSIV